jgi:ketosteroid isomerase-like protein
MTGLDLAEAALAATDAWLEAYRERDMERATRAFAADMGVVVFGTGPDERCLGLAEIRDHLERDWAQAEASSVERGYTTTRVTGGAVIVAFDCHFGFCVDEHHQTTSGRATIILERQDTQLKIVHAHFSIPAAEQPVGRSFW